MTMEFWQVKKNLINPSSYSSVQHRLQTLSVNKINVSYENAFNSTGLRVRFSIFIGPILDDRLKDKFLKHWKGVLCIYIRVCLSVCTRATEHTFWPMNLIFGSSDPSDMRKKQHNFCFSKFSFLRLLLAFFDFFLI